MSDRKRRYESNLKLKQDTNQNFFFWLNNGEGKDVSLEERPHATLDEQRVQYLQEHERTQFVVHMVNGLLYYKAANDTNISQVPVDAGDQDDE
ncbi:hypothetical protein BGZ50_002451 [Haplosporangium sp. Z 11]|nr:hypothetical protein BGZ50_002451 [Haplosporangium sp. Z 11]